MNFKSRKAKSCVLVSVHILVIAILVMVIEFLVDCNAGDGGSGDCNIDDGGSGYCNDGDGDSGN